MTGPDLLYTPPLGSRDLGSSIFIGPPWLTLAGLLPRLCLTWAVVSCAGWGRASNIPFYLFSCAHLQIRQGNLAAFFRASRRRGTPPASRPKARQCHAGVRGPYCSTGLETMREGC